MKTFYKSALHTVILLASSSYTVAQTVNWNGYYTGLSIGYNSGYLKPSNLQFSRPGSIAYNFHEEIEYAGIITEHPSNSKFKIGKYSLGLQFGHLSNVAGSPWVTGWELSLQKFSKRTKNNVMKWNSESQPYMWEFRIQDGESQIKFNGKTKFLLGYKIGENWLPYATIGGALTKINLKFGNNNRNCARAVLAESFSCEDLDGYNWGRSDFSTSHSYMSYGLTYGAGLFYALNDNWLINTELSRTHLKPISGYKGTRLSGAYTSFNIGLSYKF